MKLNPTPLDNFISNGVKHTKAKTSPRKRTIVKRLQKVCTCCGRKIKIIVYNDKSYRGGHYFGRTPLFRKAELRRVAKAGTRKVLIEGEVFNVLRKSPRPQGFVEYWECPKCYWG